MKNILKYKGYHTKVECDMENGILYGKVEGIRDLVTFESDNILNIRNEFEAAVDDYLDFCEENGKTPDKEYCGSFNIRISPDLHKKIAVRAYQNNTSLNKEVELAICKYINEHQINSIIINVNSIKSEQECNVSVPFYLYNNIMTADEKKKIIYS